MDDLAQHRKRRLRELIAGRPYGGSQQNLAAAAGLSEGRISQLLDPSLAFGELSAKRIATALRLNQRYFEQDFDVKSSSGSSDTTRNSKEADARSSLEFLRDRLTAMPESDLVQATAVLKLFIDKPENIEAAISALERASVLSAGEIPAVEQARRTGTR